MTDSHDISDASLAVRANTAPLSGKKNNWDLPNPSSTAFPIVISEWPRNKREVIRIALNEYQGRKIIDCRVWWWGDDGALKPGRSGLTLAVKHLQALADSLGKALGAAQRLGLLQIDGGER